MMIAQKIRTHAKITCVTVEQTKNALEEPIHVLVESANVVSMMNVHQQKCAFLELARVSDNKYSKM